MRPGDAYWGHFAVKNAETSTNGLIQNDSGLYPRTPRPLCASLGNRLPRRSGVFDMKRREFIAFIGGAVFMVTNCLR